MGIKSKENLIIGEIIEEKPEKIKIKKIKVNGEKQLNKINFDIEDDGENEEKLYATTNENNSNDGDDDGSDSTNGGNDRDSGSNGNDDRDSDSNSDNDDDDNYNFNSDFIDKDIYIDEEEVYDVPDGTIDDGTILHTLKKVKKSERTHKFNVDDSDNTDDNSNIADSDNKDDNSDMEEKMPLIPIRGLVVIPKTIVHFDVEREKSINALETAMVSGQNIFLTAQKRSDVELPSVDDFYFTGSIAKIKQILKLPGDSIRVLVEGEYRGKIIDITSEEPYFECIAVKIKEEKIKEPSPQLEALKRIVMKNFDEYVRVRRNLQNDVHGVVLDSVELGDLADEIASYIDISLEDRQKVLETVDVKTRLEIVNEVLEVEIEIIKIKNEIAGKARESMAQSQREYVLREQLKAIKKELGTGGLDEPDEEEIALKLKKLKALKLDKKTTEKVEKEINKYKRLMPNTQEAAVVRTYLETILELPWRKVTKNKNSIFRAEEILDEDHYGLKKVKERIVEYLAVVEITKSIKGPIICLVGPPGTGKTSIAKSIARATSRDFVRMSLGGVNDEAEIRGHRRTYVGAMPGRVVNAMVDAGSKNPVFLLDEIDKIDSNYKGDPAAALLEVLDPEQNKDFMDHYLEVPFDLSKVMFITTANTIETIPGPLLDRMEVININSYTEDEKANIARKYLIPKKIKEHGMEEENISISSKALSDLINYYTREAGVRNLERELANLCRKVAKKKLTENKDKFMITNKNLESYLGQRRFKYDKVEGVKEVGITTGMAWTAVGGDTLFVEAVAVEGKGNFVLTGMLGEVMQESAKAALTYIRSKAEDFGLPKDFYESKEIHIHVPEGAIPKDGPSAGVTMTVAMVSALTEKPAKKDVAMTGEINLRGQVLPVGGIREKVLAAYRAGIRKILIPFDNAKDLEDIPQRIQNDIEFVFLKRVEEAIKEVIG